MSLPPPPPPTDSPVCYRHHDRPTGRRCTRCGKSACGDCLVQASVGSHCVDCAKAARPDVKTRARFWSARQPAMVTMTLIGINVAFFLYTAIRDPQSIGGGLTQVHVDLGLNSQILAAEGEWYRLVTSGFMHFGLIHIGFNMYLLYMLGQMLEPSLGRVKFLLVYLGGLLGGSAGSLLLDSPNAIAAGASGAVFALMGLAFVGYYLNGANPLNTSIGSLLMINLVITFLFPRISIGGHVGGAVAGALMALVVMAPRHRGYPRWAGYAAPCAVAALSVAISIAAVG
jgi:membrane associated rhomboid family serine protease